MSRYLNPSFDKLNSKGISSVRSRVVNLTELNPDVTPQRMKEKLMEAMLSSYPGTVSEAELSGSEIDKIRSSLCDPAWLYGKNSTADVTLSHRFAWGSADLLLTIRDASVEIGRAHV